MLNSELIKHLGTQLTEFFGNNIQVTSSTIIHGGSINHTYRLETNEQCFVVKLNQNQPDDFFMKESEGLEVLRSKSQFYIPGVYLEGGVNNIQYLVMEYIEEGRRSQATWEVFGRDLANLHLNTSTSFGWSNDNFIGSLNQINTSEGKWLDFFITHRLEYQLKLAYQHGLVDQDLLSRFERLYVKLESLLPAEKPALLHGDLWNGNHLTSESDKNVLIDPAIYFGHREVDISMMHLFGGFPKVVFEAYHEVFPLSPDWENRIDLFNLYPLLVHVNLFGTSYARRVSNVVDKYLK